MSNSVTTHSDASSLTDKPEPTEGEKTQNSSRGTGNLNNAECSDAPRSECSNAPRSECSDAPHPTKTQSVSGETERPEHGQTPKQPFFTTLWKYCGVSLTQTFVELGVFTVLHLIVANNIANTVAVVCSATYQFLMNRNLTFKSSSNFTRSIILFIALWVFNLAFSTAMITYLPALLGISAFIAKLIAMCCQGVWGFLLSRYVIFR